jgi:TetR/AcrR family transcriptional regulator, cholesterol catabolism regulator
MMPELEPDLPPMAAPPSLPRQRLRYARILNVAPGFARKGIDSVSLEEVADKASVSPDTLRHYFPTPTHLMLVLYRKQLNEIHPDPEERGGQPAARAGARALTNVLMEIFHMRLMQPAVEECLGRAVYVEDAETTGLLRDIDSAAEQVVTAASGDAATSKVLLLVVTGLVQSVRNRRLSLFEAEQDLKKACSLLTAGAKKT